MTVPDHVRPAPRALPDRPLADRRPLLLDVLHSELGRRGVSGEVVLVDSCPSTNALALRLAPTMGTGADWALVVADEQTAGRGRLGRDWASPAGAGLWSSVLLLDADSVSAATLGLLPLAAGVAVVDACRALGVPASLKWPNDVIIDHSGTPTKLAGLLAERSEQVVVMGVGVNVDLTAGEAPTGQAGSLRQWGLDPAVPREELLAMIVAGVLREWSELREGRSAEVLERYRAVCATLGRTVRAERPDGSVLEGTAVDIDTAGHLVLAEFHAPLTAADIVHLR